MVYDVRSLQGSFPELNWFVKLRLPGLHPVESELLFIPQGQFMVYIDKFCAVISAPLLLKINCQLYVSSFVQ